MKDKRKFIFNSLIVMTIVFAVIFGVCIFGEEPALGEENVNVQEVVQSTVQESVVSTPQLEKENQILPTEQTGKQEISEAPSATIMPTEKTFLMTPEVTAEQAATLAPSTKEPYGEVITDTAAPTDTVTNQPTTKPSTKPTKKPAIKATTVPTHKPVTPVKTPELEKKITFTVDASVIGNGQYVSGHQVTLKEGEPASVTVTRGLEEAGFSYENTGTINSNFYLARICKSGMIKNPKVSSHIQDILDENGVKLRINKYEPGSLGEFDFTKYSGWRYSVNGTYAGVGMSDYELKAGDNVLLKYTLCLGYDA